MKFSLTAAFLAVAPSLVSAVFHFPESVPKLSNELVVPGGYFVQLQDGSQLPTAKRSQLSPHDEFYQSLAKRGIGWQPRNQFSSSLFTGISLQFTGDIKQAIDALSGIQGIVDVRPIRLLPAPKCVDTRPIPGPQDPQLRDTSVSHVMTGIDKLHAEGYSGKDVSVAVIDTGVDYNHPALGGGFGPGFKVARGYDFVGDAYDARTGNPPQPDNDPMDNCFGHGTFTAGVIAAGTNNPYNISGAAPQATLSAYRVFGCDPTALTPDDIIVNAMIRAYNDGNDILNLSLGSMSAWTESMTSVIASKIASAGKVVTVSVGNLSSRGAWLPQSPATGINVISVGSVESATIPLQNATLSNGHNPIPYFSPKPLPNAGPLPIYALSTDTTIANDGCTALPSSTPNLAPYLVVLRRGGCSFIDKLNNIASRGAKQALIYNNGGAWSVINVGTFPAALINEADGAYLVSLAGTSAKISFPQNGPLYNSINPAGGLMSTFSQYGMSLDLYAQPSLSSVGGNVLSLFPVNLGSYAIQTGTSEATPLVAGAAALIMQAKGKSWSTSLGMKSLLETTSRPVPSTLDDGAPPQTVAQQGGGLIDAWGAVHYKTIVSPGELLLNDTANIDNTQTITIQNTGSKSVKYRLTHVPALTAQTYPSGSIQPIMGNLPLITASASVSFSKTSFTVLPGWSKTVTVKFTPPQVDASTFPIYSGFVKISSDSNENLSVFYIGVAAAMKDMKVVDDTDYFFGVPLPAIVDGDGNLQDQPKNYTFASADFPTILWRRTAGTRFARFDLVDANFSLNAPSRRKRGFLDFLNSLLSSWWPFGGPPRNSSPSTFDKVPVLGTLYEANYQPRHIDSQADADGPIAYQTIGMFGQFANGTDIPNKRSYRVLLRALKITGDIGNESDYETWLSPLIGVNK